jgi:hypothetical protein
MSAVVPDLIGEVVGWRAWSLVGDTDFVRLESVTQNARHKGADGIWPTNRWFVGRCLVNHVHNEPGAGIPVERCSCGVYAAKSLAQLARLSYASYGDIADKAIGEVAFAGKVIEGSQGWRAERARIKRLWLPHRLWRFVEPLQNAYGVEVGFARLLGSTIELDERAAV